ncbi:MAG: hypothetical protein R3E92_15535 [Burkholderiaceae bacterium]
MMDMLNSYEVVYVDSETELCHHKPPSRVDLPNAGHRQTLSAPACSQRCRHGRQAGIRAHGRVGAGPAVPAGAEPAWRHRIGANFLVDGLKRGQMPSSLALEGDEQQHPFASHSEAPNRYWCFFDDQTVSNQGDL